MSDVLFWAGCATPLMLIPFFLMLRWGRQTGIVVRHGGDPHEDPACAEMIRTVMRTGRAMYMVDGVARFCDDRAASGDASKEETDENQGPR